MIFISFETQYATSY